MANEQNLRNFTSDQSREEAAKNGKKGGIASGKSRREKKAIQKIVEDYLSGEIGKIESLSDLAKRAGLKESQSIKELISAICILNTLKDGGIAELQKLANLLGEENQNKDIMEKLDSVLLGIDEVIESEP